MISDSLWSILMQEGSTEHQLCSSDWTPTINQSDCSDWKPIIYELALIYGCQVPTGMMFLVVETRPNLVELVPTHWDPVSARNNRRIARKAFTKGRGGLVGRRTRAITGQQLLEPAKNLLFFFTWLALVMDGESIKNRLIVGGTYQTSGKNIVQVTANGKTHTPKKQKSYF